MTTFNGLTLVLAYFAVVGIALIPQGYRKYKDNTIHDGDWDSK